MTTIIAGSRDVSREDTLKAINLCPWKDKITTVVSGMARGPDTFGYDWAKENNIPIEEFPASWKLLGKKAGFLRNREMAINSDALIAAFDGTSGGTRHMIGVARFYKLKIFIYNTKTNEICSR